MFPALYIFCFVHLLSLKKDYFLAKQMTTGIVFHICYFLLKKLPAFFGFHFPAIKLVNPGSGPHCPKCQSGFVSGRLPSPFPPGSCGGWCAPFLPMDPTELPRLFAPALRKDHHSEGAAASLFGRRVPPHQKYLNLTKIISPAKILAFLPSQGHAAVA